MKTVDCESGAYGMSANKTGHYVDPANSDKTLCGRQFRAAKVWSRWDLPSAMDEQLKKWDCRRCLSKATKMSKDGELNGLDSQ